MHTSRLSALRLWLPLVMWFFAACGGLTTAREEPFGATLEDSEDAGVGGSMVDDVAHPRPSPPPAGASGMATGGAGGSVDGTGGYHWYDDYDACFVAGTPVSTPNGEVPIETVRVGGTVLSLDVDTGQVVERLVTAVHVHESARVGTLTLTEGVLGLTDNHPVYDAARDEYVPAGQLAADARLLSLQGVDVQTVGSSGFKALELMGPVPVYNLTVEGKHNYFASGVLVHNKSYCDPDPEPFPGVEHCPSAGCSIVWGSTENITRNAPAPEPSPPAFSMPDGSASDAGAAARGIARALVCNGEAGTPPNTRFLAFDMLRHGPYAQIGLVTGDTACTGHEIGQVWFNDHEVPPIGAWTTQCVAVESALLRSEVLVVALEAAEVGALREVASCECVRKIHTDACGFQDLVGYGGSSACR
jgi:hypothetical protein